MSTLSKIGSLIISKAPMLAKLAMNPAGATAGIALDLIGKAIGIEPEPEKIYAAIKDNPELIAKVQISEVENKTELEKAILEHDLGIEREETKRLNSENRKIKEEMNNKDPWVRRARPFFMYVIAVTWGSQMSAITWKILKASAADVSTIIEAYAKLGFMWSIALGAVGVYIKMRSDDKKPNKPLGLIGSIAEKLRK